MKREDLTVKKVVNVRRKSGDTLCLRCCVFVFVYSELRAKKFLTFSFFSLCLRSLCVGKTHYSYFYFYFYFIICFLIIFLCQISNCDSFPL